MNFAGGGILFSNSSVTTCQFSVVKHKLCEDFKVLNLPGHDVVLGCDWFEKHSPFTMDFQQNTITILKEGTPITLKTCTMSHDLCKIPAEEMQKLLEQGASA